jgi:hypothetical protein
MLTLFDKILKEVITHNMAFQTISLNDGIFMLKNFSLISPYFFCFLKIPIERYEIEFG